MSEVVTPDAVDESPDAAEAPTTPTVDEATWKKRLAGKDQALTAAQKERDELRKQYEDAQRRIAEREQADLSETERLQLRVRELEEAANAAKAEATRERLARKFPLAFDLLGDATPLDEVRLSEIETRLAKPSESDDEPEPRIDPNSPRRRTPAPVARSREDIRSDLIASLKAQFPA